MGADRSLEATAGVQVREVQGWTGCRWRVPETGAWEWG